MSAHRKDITGKRFGMLRAVSPAYKRGSNWKWHFQCDCGKECVKTASDVRIAQIRGVVQSCGCVSRVQQSINRSTHGMTNHPAFSIWSGMKRRCYYVKHPAYHRYGGRGITVCDEWAASFEAFWADMGPTYELGLELDRVDTAGDYTPSNTRWVTRKQNNRNKRNNRLIETPWGCITVAEASEKANIRSGTIFGRLRHGWDSIAAVTTPVGGAA